jgi:DNA-binding beta-propeller fold protein YncE
MKGRRNLYVGVSLVTLVIVLTAAQFMLQTKASAQGNQIGMYEIDRAWPKMLPNHWVLGSTVGLGIDSHDNVYVVHRGKAGQDPKLFSMDTFPPPAPRGGGARGARGGAPAPAGRDAAAGETAATGTKPISDLCCTEAPPVLEFNSAGDLIGHWGGPGAGYEWPPSMHGITVDAKDNVWLAGNGGNTVLKFANNGKFLMQVGKNGASKGNKDTDNFSNPAEVSVDDAANEVYVADGYGNRRVIVIDATTGKFKRMWGAYGKPPVDQTNVPYDPTKTMQDYQYFQVVHCATLANDGQVYVCDRNHNRVQIFKKDGSYVKETQISRKTTGDGVTFDIAFSKDAAQRLMYVADGADHRIWQLLREPLTVINHIGEGGRYPGQFYAIHNVSLDSKGNIYTTETYTGARVQKFSYKGMGAAPSTPEGPHN